MSILNKQFSCYSDTAIGLILLRNTLNLPSESTLSNDLLSESSIADALSEMELCWL